LLDRHGPSRRVASPASLPAADDGETVRVESGHDGDPAPSGRVDGYRYGYPQLTEQAKRKILGENLLRLHGMDVEATRARLRA